MKIMKQKKSFENQRIIIKFQTILNLHQYVQSTKVDYMLAIIAQSSVTQKLQICIHEDTTR